MISDLRKKYIYYERTEGLYPKKFFLKVGRKHLSKAARTEEF